MDHRHLNKEVPEFAAKIPTTENIAIAIWQRLKDKLKVARVASGAGVRDAGPVCGFLRRSMKAHLTRRYMLAASHRLHASTLSEEQNHAIYGKCNNPHGHGHNYAVEVTVSGQVSAETGMVCNLVDLDEAVRQSVIERFDHQNLNTLPEFAEQVPTTENLAASDFS